VSNASPDAAGLAASSLAAAGFVASSGVVVASSGSAVAATEFGASCRVVVADAVDRADIHADIERQKVVMAQSHIEDSVVVVEVESSYS